MRMKAVKVSAVVRKTLVAAWAAALGLCAATGMATAGDATGVWRMENGKVTVRVSRCGASLCGTVVGLRKPRDDKGRPRLDKENPNPALRRRPVIGLTILSNMKPRGEGYWTGTIYNPDDGNTYSSNMMLQSANTMRVKGCVASVLCRSMKFVRVQ
jgi:uncharacterized protein (DUF2147 family)